MTATGAKPALAKIELKRDNSRRDELIAETLPLVNAIALHIQRSLPIHIELDDLAHAGMMGLFDAATKYQPDKEVAFSSYAKHRIKGAIIDSLRQQDWASRDLRKRYKQMESVMRELAETLHRDPTEAELAAAMSLSIRRYRALVVDFRSLGLAAAQLRSSKSDSPSSQDAQSLPDHRPDQLFARTEMREKISMAMKTLPQRHQEVVSLYYDRELTMKEIGNHLGINESRVSQIHKSALTRMHSVLGNNGIQSANAFFRTECPTPTAFAATA